MKGEREGIMNKTERAKLQLIYKVVSDVMQHIDLDEEYTEYNMELERYEKLHDASAGLWHLLNPGKGKIELYSDGRR